MLQLMGIIAGTGASVVLWGWGEGANDFRCGYGNVWLVVIIDGRIIYWNFLSPGLHLHPPLIPYRHQTLSRS
jgi:hypothetical protein